MSWTPDQTLQELETQTILKTLEYYNWTRTKAARSLGISTRGLRLKITKLRDMGVSVPDNPDRYHASVCWLHLRGGP